MIKKIVACFLLISLILSFSLVFSAAKSECTEKQVAVYFDGVYKQETVLVEEGNVYVPVFWLQYYGLMNYSEEGEYYKFYYPIIYYKKMLSNIYICIQKTVYMV